MGAMVRRSVICLALFLLNPSCGFEEGGDFQRYLRFVELPNRGRRLADHQNCTGPSCTQPGPRSLAERPPRDPQQPYDHAAWPSPSWTVSKAASEGYSILPCANFLEVQGPDAPGCRKRMPAVATAEELSERKAWYEDVFKAGPFGRAGRSKQYWAQHVDLPQKLEIRVGMTVSLTGSLANARLARRNELSLRRWALDYAAAGTSFCLAFCVKDDQSSAQHAKEIYRRFADPLSGEDVDVMLGPLSFELREDAAMVANMLGRPLILWSYPKHFYDMGLGSTMDMDLAKGGPYTVFPVLQLEITSTDLSVRAKDIYVDYYQEGLYQYGGVTKVLTSGFVRLNFDHKVAMEMLSDAPMVFELRLLRGEWRDLEQDEVAARIVWDWHQLSQARDEMSLMFPINYNGRSFHLWVAASLTERTWFDFFAEKARAFRRSRRQELEVLQRPVTEVLQALPELEGLKAGEVELVKGPNARMRDDVVSLGPQVLESAAEHYRQMARRIDGDFRREGIWKVKGPCSVDAQGCLMSPNYPGHYSKELCTASMAEADDTRQLVLTDMDTERLADVLWLSGPKIILSGRRSMPGLYLSEVGEVVWVPDHTVNHRGWRLCPKPVQDESCLSFSCSEGLKPRQLDFQCKGLCNAMQCCINMTEEEVSSDGQLWEQGYRNVFDITVPHSVWLSDALSSLRKAGAEKIVGIYDRGSWRDERVCRQTMAKAERLGFSFSVIYANITGVDAGSLRRLLPAPDITGTGWDEFSFALWTMELDVVVVCGEAPLLGQVLNNKVQASYLLADPLGSSLMETTKGSSLLNYVLEPTPWPSLQWLLATYQQSFLKWTARLLSEGLQPGLLDMQHDAAIRVLTTAADDAARGPRGRLVVNSSALVASLVDLNRQEVYSLMGLVKFSERGKRLEHGCFVGTSQRWPLPRVSNDDRSELSWSYWWARSLYSQHRVMVNGSLSFAELLQDARRFLTLPAATDHLQLDWYRPSEAILSARNFVPSLEMISELVFPMPDPGAVKEEVFPCPRGCERGSLGCVACPPGKFRSAFEEACTSCSEGHRNPYWASAECEHSCPHGAICAKNDTTAQIGTQPGWWRAKVGTRIERGPDSCSEFSDLSPEQVDRERLTNFNIFSCEPMAWLCLGGPENKCVGSNTGLLCRMCKPGHTWMRFGPSRQRCRKCPGVLENLFSSVLPVILLFWLLCFTFNHAATLKRGMGSSMLLPALRILFEHMTTQNFLLESLGLGRNSEYAPYTDLIARPLDVMALDCLTDEAAMDPHRTVFRKVRSQIVGAFVASGLGFLFILLAWLLRTTYHKGRYSLQLWRQEMEDFAQLAAEAENAASTIFGRQEGTPRVPTPGVPTPGSSQPHMHFTKAQKQARRLRLSAQRKFRNLHSRFAKERLMQDAVRHCVIWLYVTSPCLLRLGIRSQVCIDVGKGELRLENFPDLRCDEELFLKDLLPLARFMTFFYLIVVPSYFAYIVVRNQDFVSQANIYQTYGLLFQGYRKEACFFELLVMLRWILQLLAMLIVNGAQRGIFLLCMFLVIQRVEGRVKPYLPLEHDALQLMFAASFRVHMITLGLGFLRLLPTLLNKEFQGSSYAQAAKEVEAPMLLIILLNNLFFYAWAFHSVFFNSFIKPIAILASSLGDGALSRAQLSALKLFRRLHGINIMVIKESPWRHMKEGGKVIVELWRLTDSERQLLLTALMNGLTTVQSMRNLRFAAIWISELLQEALKLVQKDHQQRQQENAVKRHALHAVLRRSTSALAGTLFDRRASSSDFLDGTSSHALVEEVSLALVHVTADISDCILHLTELGREEGVSNVSQRLEKGSGGDHDDDEGLQGPFHHWRLELEVDQDGAGTVISRKRPKLPLLRRYYDSEEEDEAPRLDHFTLKRLVLEAEVELRMLRIRKRLQQHAHRELQSHEVFFQSQVQLAHSAGRREGPRELQVHEAEQDVGDEDLEDLQQQDTALRGPGGAATLFLSRDKQEPALQEPAPERTKLEAHLDRDTHWRMPLPAPSVPPSGKGVALQGPASSSRAPHISEERADLPPSAEEAAPTQALVASALRQEQLRQEQVRQEVSAEFKAMMAAEAWRAARSADEDPVWDRGNF